MPDTMLLSREALTGLGQVSIPQPVDLDAEPAQVIGFIRFLRDAAACRVDVSWTGRCADPELLRALTHLPPPAEPPNDAEQWAEWRRGYRQGLLYRRKGPGFVIVHDRRPHQPKPLRFSIGDARLLAALDQGDQPMEFAGGQAEAAVRHLAKAGLMLILGPYALTLPYRISAWPVPAYSI